MIFPFPRAMTKLPLNLFDLNRVELPRSSLVCSKTAPTCFSHTLSAPAAAHGQAAITCSQQGSACVDTHCNLGEEHHDWAEGDVPAAGVAPCPRSSPPRSSARPRLARLSFYAPLWTRTSSGWSAETRLQEAAHAWGWCRGQQRGETYTKMSELLLQEGSGRRREAYKFIRAT
jgi:hypothetical protein